MTQSPETLTLKKKAGRPLGSGRFGNYVRDAALLGCTPRHLRWCLTGTRKSPELMAAYLDLKHGPTSKKLAAESVAASAIPSIIPPEDADLKAAVAVLVDAFESRNQARRAVIAAQVLAEAEVAAATATDLAKQPNCETSPPTVTCSSTSR